MRNELAFCRNCALLAAALLGGCNPAYRGNPMGVTAVDVIQARRAICEAARLDHEQGDSLVQDAVRRCGNEAAVGMALFDYQSGVWDEDDFANFHITRVPQGRIAELLHQHPAEMGS